MITKRFQKVKRRKKRLSSCSRLIV